MEAPQPNETGTWEGTTTLCSKLWRLLAVRVLATLANTSAFAQLRGWAARETPVIAARTLRGAGAWQTDGAERRASERWQLDLRRDGHRLTGTVLLSGSPLGSQGNVDGEIDGNRVAGTIVSAAGDDLATFRGVLTENGLRGTYRDRTGERGTWTWEGTLPE